MSARIALALALVVILFALPSAGAAADEAAAWEALRAGGHVALMRHTRAPGAGDPPGFTLDNCATQRNLSAEGRSDAAEIGARLKAESVSFARILSSPWCRCVDTATLLGMGPVETDPTFSNAFVLSDRRDALTEGARRVLAGWQDGTLLVVTHGANIRTLTDISPASGEIVVVKVGTDGSVAPVGRIPPPE